MSTRPESILTIHAASLPHCPPTFPRPFLLSSCTTGHATAPHILVASLRLRARAAPSRILITHPANQPRGRLLPTLLPGARAQTSSPSPTRDLAPRASSCFTTPIAHRRSELPPLGHSRLNTFLPARQLFLYPPSIIPSKFTSPSSRHNPLPPPILTRPPGPVQACSWTVREKRAGNSRQSGPAGSRGSSCGPLSCRSPISEQPGSPGNFSPPSVHDKGYQDDTITPFGQCAHDTYCHIASAESRVFAVRLTFGPVA